MKNCIVVTGGGTAGHIMPIVALLPELKKYYKNIVYIGSKGGMEKQIISAYPFVRYFEVTAVKFDRVKFWKNFAIPFLILKGIRECKKIYSIYTPNCIFSKGGYVALPAVFASRSIPVISHESDTTLGLANKLIYTKCKVMCTNFSQTAKKLKKGVYSGLPIRVLEQGKVKLKLNLNKNLPNVLIMGGSLGATSINQTVQIIVDKLCAFCNIIHIVGSGNISHKTYPKNYNQIEFTTSMGYLYSLTSVAVSRAGANSIAELRNKNIPMLLIPLSKKVSRGDQEKNAELYAKLGWANVLYSQHLTAQNLLNGIKFLLQNANKIKKAQKQDKVNSIEIIMQQLLKYSK